jgi:hypothetical protein
MPKKLHPFQRELQERSNDKARIERELKLRQRVHRFAELSEKERRQRFAILIAERQRRQYLQKLSDDEELDSGSSSDVEATVQNSSSQTEKSITRTFDYVEFIFGLILGLFIGLVTSISISNE